MKRIAIVAALGAVVAFSTAVTAADDPIATRQAMMKDVGASMGVLGKMAKGEMEFDATAAQLAIRVMHAVSLGYGEMFPEGSESADSEAAPAIWSNADGFSAELVKFQESTSGALATPPSSQEELGPVLGTLGQSCKGCHEGFRQKKS